MNADCFHALRFLAACLLTAAVQPLGAQAAPGAGPGRLKTVTAFDGLNGSSPGGGLIFGKNGALYGTTAYGGTFGYGNVFKLTGQGAQRSVTTLHSFDGFDGAFPGSALVADASGALYGTTFNSITAYGSIYRIDPDTGATTVLYLFGNGSDGGQPNAELILDGHGSAYGTTTVGALGYGTVFRLDLATNQLTTLHSFNFTDGAYPYTGLAFDRSGALWGTAPLGGPAGFGVLYRLDPVTQRYTIRYGFDGASGEVPESGVTITSGGQLLGTTAVGGDPTTCAVPGGTYTGCGTAYQFDPRTDAFTVLHTFTGGRDGGAPEARLVEDGRGNLYGTTYYGGRTQDCTVVTTLSPGCGTVFRIDRGTGRLSTVHAFTGGSDGANLFAPIVISPSGALFGVASAGGDLAACPYTTAPAGCGTVFRISP